MAEGTKSRRHVRKAAIRLFESKLDIQRFDYKKLVRPVKGRARLIGVIVASAIYFLGYGAGYFGWASGYVPDTAFMKLTWILLIPASVVGSVTWMIMDARLEYPLRRELAEYVGDIESDGGFLWRFSPVIAMLRIKKVDLDHAVSMSKAGKGADIDPQDYAMIVTALYKQLNSLDARQMTGEVSAELERNIA